MNNNTYQIKLTYPRTLSLDKITSLVESVKGVKIQRLKFISEEKDFVGVLVLEASDLLKFKSVLKLIRSRNEVYVEEQWC